MIKLAVFDVDGTLVTKEEDFRQGSCIVCPCSE